MDLSNVTGIFTDSDGDVKANRTDLESVLAGMANSLEVIAMLVSVGLIGFPIFLTSGTVGLVIRGLPSRVRILRGLQQSGCLSSATNSRLIGNLGKAS